MKTKTKKVNGMEIIINNDKITYNNKSINVKRMSNGNKKVKKALIFNLPAVKSCLNCKDCKKSCYALKAEAQYKDAKKYRDQNFNMLNNNLELLKALLILQIDKSRTNVIRIHESGDYYNQDYINMWYDIIKLYPNKLFYSYTKVNKILDFTKINKLKNFNLIESYINGHLNYGSKEYVLKLKDKYNTFICPAVENKKIKCNIHCKYCITNNNVAFIVH